MTGDRPNRVHLCGSVTFGAPFGAVASVTPIYFPGAGHVPHVEARFVGGVRMSLTPDTLTELLEKGGAALAKLPYIPDVHDAIGLEDG